MKNMNKILDNLNKYIKEDLIAWITNNIIYHIDSMGSIEIHTPLDLSEFDEIEIDFDILLNGRIFTYYIKYENKYKNYFLCIQNIPLGINLRFNYCIESEQELFRIINLFSECLVNGYYIYDESFFYEGGNNE